jgi:hypothetical protein
MDPPSATGGFGQGSKPTKACPHFSPQADSAVRPRARSRDAPSFQYLTRIASLRVECCK